MYNPYSRYANSYNTNIPIGNSNYLNNEYRAYPYPYGNNSRNAQYTSFGDYGPEPFVINIEDITKQNVTFRTALWTETISINVGEDIKLESSKP